jgi:hypothetical protein
VPGASDTPRRTYDERCRRFAGLRDAEARRSRALSALRLGAFLVAVALGVTAEAGASRTAGVAAAAALMAFAGLVVQHGRVRRRLERYETLRSLNDEGLRRLDRDWAALPERPVPAGVEPPAFAADLDLFGRPALAQLFGRTTTPAGSAALAGWLTAPASPDAIEERQAAIGELAPRNDFRDAFQAAGMQTEARAEEIEPFLEWAVSPPWLARRTWLVAAAYVLPAALVALAALQAAGVIEAALWLVPVLLMIVVSAGPGRGVRGVFRRAFAREGVFRGWPALFEAVRDASFESRRLVALRAALVVRDADAATHMRRLARLMHHADLRHSGLVHAVVQALTLWDVHVLVGVERWQRIAGPHVRGWLDAMGEIEALAALAALAHDHPHWAVPEIARDGPPQFIGEAIGHPMLPDAVRVDNDVAVGPPGSFLLVTGSNMSGKSTLLRSIGLNVVLALAGAPVCARRLRLPVVALQTSIHVQDSLVEGVSYFMAQLRRMKAIVEAADRAAAGHGPPVLYLLDEILQGTNTAERRIAATRVIRHLIDRGTIGAVTTHDLELADEPALAAAARPVHFREHVAREAGRTVMTFDYVLRPGVATSTNALRLMEIVGLDG